MGNGSHKLRETHLENPVVGAAYQLLKYDNPKEDEEKLMVQFLGEYGGWIVRDYCFGAACSRKGRCLWPLSLKAFGPLARNASFLKCLAS